MSTEDSQIKRKLTAILAADAVNFSRMASENEEQTLRVLDGHRSIIDAVIDDHGGRVVNTAGDSVLAEFSSAVEAVRCAIEIQEALKTRNESLSPSQRMDFRIGVNLGDVMISGEDLLGDGVNVAARLQSIADPGGILISSSVYDQISGKINLYFADIGEQALKNISRPIRVYRLAGSVAPKKLGRVIRRSGRRISWGVVLLTGCVAVTALVWYSLNAFSPKVPPVNPNPVPQSTAAREHPPADIEHSRLLLEKEKALNEAKIAKLQMELELQKARAAAEKDKNINKNEPSAPPAPPLLPPPALTPEKAQAPNLASTPEQSPTVTHETALQWVGTLTCETYKDLPETRVRLPVIMTNGEFVFEKDLPGQPGYVFLQGKPSDGLLAMTGSAVSASKAFLGRQAPASFRGKLDGNAYHLKGEIGRRSCTFDLENKTYR